MMRVMGAVAAGVLVLVWAVPAGAQASKTAQGEKVFAAQKCSLCHGIAGKGNQKHALDGVGKTITAEMAKLWLTDPKAAEAKAGKKAVPPMKSFASLPPDDLEALVAYLLSLK